MLRRIGIIVVLGLIVAALTAVPAIAASPHFKGQNSPTFSQPTPTTLNASGALAGLGNFNTFVQLDASGVPDVTCTSPGGNEAPGLQRYYVATGRDHRQGGRLPEQQLDRNDQLH